MAGRGFGKTRTGAEWVRNLVETGQAKRIALIAPTGEDARKTMVEGESGLEGICPPWNRAKFFPAKRTVVWKNGAKAFLYSAEEPERLRGPQFDAAWCDEMCAWKRAEATWDNLMFGLRLGKQPRTCITTTPKPIILLKNLVAQNNVQITRGTTFDNLQNLAPSFASEIISKYEGTRVGRQELMAEILKDVPGALWQRAEIDSHRVNEAPPLERLVVAVDPPISVGENADECGIVAAGLGQDSRGYIVADRSVQGLSPAGWANKAVGLYHELGADRIVIEVNQGGVMCESVLRQVDANVPVKMVHASRGKVARAEPVAAVYEQGRVSHVGSHPLLEDQMCSFTGSFDRDNQGSPDRVDALVWALTHLMLAPNARPQIRSL